MLIASFESPHERNSPPHLSFFYSRSGKRRRGPGLSFCYCGCLHFLWNLFSTHTHLYALCTSCPLPSVSVLAPLASRKRYKILSQEPSELPCCYYCSEKQNSRRSFIFDKKGMRLSKCTIVSCCSLLQCEDLVELAIDGAGDASIFVSFPSSP